MWNNEKQSQIRLSYNSKKIQHNGNFQLNIRKNLNLEFHTQQNVSKLGQQWHFQTKIEEFITSRPIL